MRDRSNSRAGSEMKLGAMQRSDTMTSADVKLSSILKKQKTKLKELQFDDQFESFGA